MIASVLLLALLVVVAVTVVRVLAHRPGAPAARTSSLRELFTYVLLLVAVLVTSTGTAGLLGQLLDRYATDGPLVTGSVEAARNGAFVVVGLPLGLLVGLVIRRALRDDPAERTSFGWAAYVTAGSVVPLVVAMVAVHDSLGWAFGVDPENPRAVARAVVWSLVWLVHWRLDRALTPADHATPHLLLGSALGLGTTVVGAVGAVGNSLDLAFGLQRDTFVDPQDQLRRAAATLLVGAGVWTLYWWRHASARPRALLTDAYALAAGTVVGIVAGVVGTVWALSDVLVRVLGSPAATAAAEHFRNTPHLLATAAAGALLWWYHTGLLTRPAATAAPGRDEAHRLRDYASAVLGLLATCVGGAMLVVALVDALTRSVAVAGTPAANIALVAVSALVVGLPVWWLAWRTAQAACRTAPGPERASVTRRTYLVAVTGVGVLVAVGALIGVVYLLLEDLFAGALALGTLRSLRYALGVLVVAAAVAGAHAALFRAERALRPHAVQRVRYVVLVGAGDPALAHEVAATTGARVLSWPRTDGAAPVWSVADVARLVAASPGPDVVVVQTPDGLLAVPVDRHRGDVAAVTVPLVPPGPPAAPATSAGSGAVTTS
ncbi:MAG: hypothetical protein HY830_25775 [Actinobacteria bacterium]|nr:hypothetical protein [Actinomycetota bacterium]